MPIIITKSQLSRDMICVIYLNLCVAALEESDGEQHILLEDLVRYVAHEQVDDQIARALLVQLALDLEAPQVLLVLLGQVGCRGGDHRARRFGLDSAAEQQIAFGIPLIATEAALGGEKLHIAFVRLDVLFEQGLAKFLSLF